MKSECNNMHGERIKICTFISVFNYSRIGCVYVVMWVCVVDSRPVIKNNFTIGIGLSCECVTKSL